MQNIKPLIVFGGLINIEELLRREIYVYEDMKKEDVLEYFKVGDFYSREEIHRQFGGNPQSGCCISGKYPVIFIFVSDEGKKYGYEDGVMPDGYLHIAGEGQKGDMNFTRGNKAIRDHIKNGRALLYFSKGDGRKRRYEGEITLHDYFEKTLKDVEGKERKGIVFRFLSANEITVNREQENFEKKTHREGAERRIIMTIKERNPELRDEAIGHYGKKCMVCGFDFDEVYGPDLSKGYIEVHHEKLLADSEGERDATVEEVKVVCSNCHRMIHRKKDMMDWQLLREKVRTRRNGNK